MALPNVNVNFVNGQIPSAPANIDNVFLAIGPSSLGQIDTVYPIVQASQITSTLGYGPLAELVAQMFSTPNGPSLVYACPANQTQSQGTNTDGIGAIVKGRSGGPTMSCTGLIGIPGLPLAANYNNTGAGLVKFDSSSVPSKSTSVSVVTVTVTTGGALGAAAATIQIGSESASTGVTLGNSPWSDPNGSGIVLDFSVASLGGKFALGDSFEAIATSVDTNSVQFTLNSINAQGVAQWTYSLDGGNTTAALTNYVGCEVTSSGEAANGLALPSCVVSAGSNPSTTQNVVVSFAQSGVATGVTAQSFPNSSGLAVNSGAGLATMLLYTAQADTVTTPSAFKLTVTLAGALTTAKGTLTINGSPSTQSTTPFTNIDIPSTWTDDATGNLFHFSTSPGNFVLGNVYTTTVNPIATYSVTINGTPVADGPFDLASTGIVSNGLPDSIALTFGHSNTDNYIYSSLTPSETNVYSVNFYPAQVFPQVGSSLIPQLGWQATFGYGTYDVGDTYDFMVYPPSVVTSDVQNALNASFATQGIAFSMVEVASSPATFAAAATTASAVNTILSTQAGSPTYIFVGGVVFGPDLPSSDETAAQFITATNSLDLEFVGMCCGADNITSALTGRQNLRNEGYTIGPRYASISVQVDPGYVGGGPLNNDVSTTTPLSDATEFDSNRGMTSTTYSGLTGVYCNQGLSLAALNSDYALLPRRRIINKAARYARNALLAMVNGTVRVQPGTGYIDPKDAATIANTVTAQVANACQGNFQQVTVTPSLTDDILSTGEETVEIAVLPYGYLKYITAEVGFTVGSAS